MQQDPTLRALAQAEFSRGLDDADPVFDAVQDPSSSAQLLAHGIVPPGLRSTIRRTAIAEVIRPCAAQLLTSTWRAARLGAKTHMALKVSKSS